MADGETIQSLMSLRKLTRAIADVVRTRVSEHLNTLAPLLRPDAFLGHYVVGGVKEFTRRAEQGLKDVQALYGAIAPAKPFNLRRELTPPFDLGEAKLEITPVEYVHVIQSGPDTRRIRVRCPFVWTVSYDGFALSRLPELLEPRARGDELQRFIVSHLVLNTVATHQRGVVNILNELHLPVTTIRLPEFGELPLTRIGVAVSTHRPADAIVIEMAELTGFDLFEELINVDDLAALHDGFRDQLLDIARQHSPSLAAT
jgi:hypothetical protein